MDLIFRVMGVFIEYPLLAAAIGVLLVGLGRIMHRGLAMTAGVMWLIYSLWEFAIKKRWLCRGDCDIRADLLFIYPVLLQRNKPALLKARPRELEACHKSTTSYSVQIIAGVP
jgi:hypothetical protein